MSVAIPEPRATLEGRKGMRPMSAQPERTRKRPVITPSEINYYLAQGYSQAKIAEMHGVTPQYISWIKKEYGGVTESPWDSRHELWPWKSTEFHLAAPELRLRDHLRYRSSGTKGMSEKRIQLLRGFYKRLRENNEVVEFDPTIPPHKGVFTGGWAYRPRVESDGELIIRVNEHTKDLTERMKMIWRFPPKLPE